MSHGSANTVRVQNSDCWRISGHACHPKIYGVPMSHAARGPRPTLALANRRLIVCVVAKSILIVEPIS